MTASAPQGPPRRRFRPYRALLRLTLALLVGLVLVEGTLRFALFHDSAFARRLGQSVRSPEKFASKRADSYWKLQSELNAKQRKSAPTFDQRLGWTRVKIPAGNYTHAEFDPQDSRRPILLYGDSFAQCETKPTDCWQGLLERSDLADRYQFVNYGVGGYGFDQAYLLYLESIDLYADRNPLVILSALVDSDLERSRLAFRGWAKPRFQPVGEDGLELDDNPIIESVEDYIDEVGIGIPWYSWAYLVHGTTLLPDRLRQSLRDVPDELERVRDINRRILLAWHTDIEARGLDAFCMLYHGRAWLDANKHDWRDAFMERQLKRLGLPFESSKQALREDARQTGRHAPAYFISSGLGRGHYNPLGNEVVFRSLRAGIERY